MPNPKTISDPSIKAASNHSYREFRIKPTQERKHFFRRSIRLRGLIIVAGVIASTATILGFFGSLGWFLDLFSHFRVQYFLGLTALALLLLPMRQHKTAACFGVFAILNFLTILPLYFDGVDYTVGAEPRLRAMLLNVNTRFGNVESVSNAITQYDPDILVLEEISNRWVEELRSTMDAYPHSKVQPREDNFGIGLYSRLPFTRADIVYIGDAKVPSIVAEIQTGSANFTVIATHPLPPGGGSYSRWRNEQLDKIPDYVGKTDLPVLLLGDLNVTPWNHHFKQLLRRTGLKDSSQGRGVQPTWPTQNLLLRIPIDHCLHSSEIKVVEKEIGPHVGSDHYPVIVDFIIQSEKRKDGSAIRLP